MLFGDAFGRISIMNQFKFIYHETISYNQIISIKWIFKDQFCFITTDGAVTFMRFNGSKCEKIG